MKKSLIFGLLFILYIVSALANETTTITEAGLTISADKYYYGYGDTEICFNLTSTTQNNFTVELNNLDHSYLDIDEYCYYETMVTNFSTTCYENTTDSSIICDINQTYTEMETGSFSTPFFYDIPFEFRSEPELSFLNQTNGTHTTSELKCKLKSYLDNNPLIIREEKPYRFCIPIVGELGYEQKFDINVNLQNGTTVELDPAITLAGVTLTNLNTQYYASGGGNCIDGSNDGTRNHWDLVDTKNDVNALVSSGITVGGSRSGNSGGAWIFIRWFYTDGTQTDGSQIQYTSTSTQYKSHTNPNPSKYVNKTETWCTGNEYFYAAGAAQTRFANATRGYYRTNEYVASYDFNALYLDSDCDSTDDIQVGTSYGSYEDVSDLSEYSFGEFRNTFFINLPDTGECTYLTMNATNLTVPNIYYEYPDTDPSSGYEGTSQRFQVEFNHPLDLDMNCTWKIDDSIVETEDAIDIGGGDYKCNYDFVLGFDDAGEYNVSVEVEDTDNNIVLIDWNFTVIDYQVQATPVSPADDADVYIGLNNFTFILNYTADTPLDNCSIMRSEYFFEHEPRYQFKEGYINASDENDVKDMLIYDNKIYVLHFENEILIYSLSGVLLERHTLDTSEGYYYAESFVEIGGSIYVMQTDEDGTENDGSLYTSDISYVTSVGSFGDDDARKISKDDNYFYILRWDDSNNIYWVERFDLLGNPLAGFNITSHIFLNEFTDDRNIEDFHWDSSRGRWYFGIEDTINQHYIAVLDENFNFTGEIIYTGEFPSDFKPPISIWTDEDYLYFLSYGGDYGRLYYNERNDPVMVTVDAGSLINNSENTVEANLGGTAFTDGYWYVRCYDTSGKVQTGMHEDYHEYDSKDTKPYVRAANRADPENYHVRIYEGNDLLFFVIFDDDDSSSFTGKVYVNGTERTELAQSTTGWGGMFMSWYGNYTQAGIWNITFEKIDDDLNSGYHSWLLEIIDEPQPQILDDLNMWQEGEKVYFNWNMTDENNSDHSHPKFTLNGVTINAAPGLLWELNESYPIGGYKIIEVGLTGDSIWITDENFNLSIWDYDMNPVLDAVTGGAFYGVSPYYDPNGMGLFDTDESGWILCYNDSGNLGVAFAQSSDLDIPWSTTFTSMAPVYIRGGCFPYGDIRLFNESPDDTMRDGHQARVWSVHTMSGTWDSSWRSYHAYPDQLGNTWWYGRDWDTDDGEVRDTIQIYNNMYYLVQDGNNVEIMRRWAISGVMSSIILDIDTILTLPSGQEAYGMDYRNGYLYVVTSSGDGVNNTLWKFRHYIDVTDYFDSSDSGGNSAENGDNLTLEVMSDNSIRWGNTLSTSLLLSGLPEPEEEEEEDPEGGDASTWYKDWQEEFGQEEEEPAGIDIVTGALFATVGLGEEGKTDIQIDSLSKEFWVFPGDEKKEEMTIYNTENTPRTITLEILDEGDAYEWLSFNGNNRKVFTIQAYDDSTIKYNIVVPEKIKPGDYMAYISVDAGDNIATYEITIHVMKEELKPVIIIGGVAGLLVILSGMYLLIFKPI